MRVIQKWVGEVAGMVSEPELFKVKPRMDTNEHECKRITCAGVAQFCEDENCEYAGEEKGPPDPITKVSANS